MRHVLFATLLAAALLAACSGGGGSSPGTTLPAAPLATGTGVAPAGAITGTRGTVSLTIPASKAVAAAKRHAQFVSSAASSAVIAINGGSPASYDVSATSTYCSAVTNGRTCSLPIGVPTGTTSVSVTLSIYDGAGGTGTLLGSGTGSTTIATGATSFAVALDVSPVVASVAFSLSFPSTGLPRISYGYNETGANAGTMTLTFSDPDGVVIPATSTSTFLTPITLGVVDPTNSVTISPATITNATQTASVAYGGGSTIGPSVTFNAVAGSTTIGTLVSKTSGYQTVFPISQTTNSPPPTEPYGIVVGPDGNLWFTESANSRVGKMSTAGTLLAEDVLPTPAVSPKPFNIAAGPSGDTHVWYVIPSAVTNSSYGFVGNADVTSGATAQFFTGNGSSNPTGVLAVGNNMWFSLYGQSAILITNTAGVSQGFITMASGSGPSGMAIGPDGNVWVANIQNGTIASYNATTFAPAFAAMLVPSGSGAHPANIIAGPDGALWFTEQLLANIGRVTTTGAMTEYTMPSPYGQPYAIVNGSDGGIWFTTNAAPTGIVRIDPTTHAFVGYHLQSTQASWGLVSGPDGNLWATDFLGGHIIRIQP
jgi:streptogramin lyase